MKKIIIGLLVTVLVFVASIGVSKAINLYYLPSSQAGGVASTTATFVLAGGTVSKTVISDGIEQVSFLVAVGSSTTPPILSWNTEYSNNGTDWYGESTLFASTTANYWVAATTTPGVTVISSGSDGKTKYVGRRIDVTNLATQYTRTTFTITGANARVDVQRSLKNTVITIK